MVINEIEAASLISLIDAFTEFKKGGSLICFLDACKKQGLIDENGTFSKGDYRKLISFRKKLNELMKEAKTLNKK